MAIKFGNSYRQETQDANDGRIDKKSTAENKRSVNVAGKNVIHADPDKNSVDDIQGLIKVATKVGQGFAKRERAKKYRAKLRGATQESQDKAFEESSPIIESFFGKSVERRAFQDATVQREGTNLATDLAASLKDDIQNFTIEQYQSERIEEKVQELLGAQSDPEVRDKLEDNLTKVAETLVREHSKQRPIYEAALNRKGTEEDLLAAGRLSREATQVQSPELVALAEERLEAAMTPKDGMSPEIQNEILVNQLVKNLSSGDDQLFNFAKNKGKLESLDEAQTEQLRQAMLVKEGIDSTKFSNAMGDLTQLIENDGANVEQEVNKLTARYGAKLVKPNKLRERHALVKVDKERERQAKAERLSNRIEGSKLGRSMSEEHKVEADTAIQTRIADLQVQQSREETLKQQIADGVSVEERIKLEEVQSQEERRNELLNNPSHLVNRWSSNAEFTPPLLNTILQEQSMLLQNEDFSEEDLETIEKNTNFIMAFKSKDRHKLAKNTLSKTVLKNVAYLDVLTRAGRSTPSALRHMQRQKERPVYEWNADPDNPEELDDAVSDILVSSGGDLGYSKWLGLLNAAPENEDKLQWDVRQAIREAGTVAKDPEEITALAKDLLMGDSVGWGNQMVTGMRKANQLSRIDLGEYAELLKDSEEWQERWKNSRFSPSTDLTDPQYSVYASPSGRVLTVTGTDENGAPIFIDFETPVNEQDLPTFKTEDQLEEIKQRALDKAREFQRGQ